MIQKFIIAFDIGASKIAYGIIEVQNSKLKIQSFNKIKTPKQKNTTIKKLVEIIKEISSNKKIIGVGIGFAGQVDFEKGKVLSSPNMPGWKNVSLKKILEKKLNLPVSIDNDANCFVLGEALFGAAKNYRHIIGLTLGTGVGGGITIDKKIYRGKNNLAGEFGHTIVETKYNLKCSCGMRGHLEAYASGRGLENLYNKLSGRKLNSFEIEKKFYQGEKTALKVFDIAAESLSEGISDLINFLDPEIIVVGGGLSKIDLFWKLIVQKTRKKVFHSRLSKTKIVRSRLQEKANIFGAASLLYKF